MILLITVPLVIALHGHASKRNSTQATGSWGLAGSGTVDRSSDSYQDGYQAGQGANTFQIGSSSDARRVCDQMADMVARYSTVAMGDGNGITAVAAQEALDNYQSTQTIYYGRTIGISTTVLHGLPRDPSDIAAQLLRQYHGSNAPGSEKLAEINAALNQGAGLDQRL